jgi:hypothetical protein
MLFCLLPIHLVKSRNHEAPREGVFPPTCYALCPQNLILECPHLIYFLGAGDLVCPTQTLTVQPLTLVPYALWHFTASGFYTQADDHPFSAVRELQSPLEAAYFVRN